MNEQLKSIISGLIDNNVSVEIILKTTGVSEEQLKEHCPFEYGKYVGIKRERFQLTKKLLKGGMKVDKVAELIDIEKFRINAFKENLDKKK